MTTGFLRRYLHLLRLEFRVLLYVTIQYLPLGTLSFLEFRKSNRLDLAVRGKFFKTIQHQEVAGGYILEYCLQQYSKA